MPEEIRTERLVLRRARLDDVPAMHAIMSDAQATRYCSTLPHATMADTEQWMRNMVGWEEGAGDDFILTLSGTLIGKLGAFQLPEIGFVLEKAHWGQGYASEALCAFIARRRALGSAELTADVDPRNLSSLALLKRNGFVETGRATGTWQIGAELCDSIYLWLML
jgi:RimJ/RimL family protein N-acetyltransferase